MSERDACAVESVCVLCVAGNLRPSYWIWNAEGRCDPDLTGTRRKQRAAGVGLAYAAGSNWGC
jgi:hypothetical protein